MVGEIKDQTDVKLKLDEEIASLKEALAKSKNGELPHSELIRLAQFDKEQAYLNQQGKTGLVDSIYNKKGILHYWYVKVPTKILNVGSILDNQKILNDHFRALASPICPLCEKGILMYDLKKPPVNGDVFWFCSQESCSYHVWSEPSNTGNFNSKLKDKIALLDKKSAWTNRWKELTEIEKNELTDKHISTSVLFRNFSFLLTAIVAFEAILGFWFAVAPTFLMALAMFVVSLKWAYFAWRIKTGEGGFLHWLKICRSLYSVDWTDDQKDDA